MFAFAMAQTSSVLDASTLLSITSSVLESNTERLLINFPDLRSLMWSEHATSWFVFYSLAKEEQLVGLVLFLKVGNKKLKAHAKLPE